MMLPWKLHSEIPLNNKQHTTAGKRHQFAYSGMKVSDGKNRGSGGLRAHPCTVPVVVKQREHKLLRIRIENTQINLLNGTRI